MADERKPGGGGNGGGVRRVTPPHVNVENAWAECYLALGVAQSTVGDALHRHKRAQGQAERDLIEDATRGFFRRLALMMLAIVYPEARVTIDDKEKP